MSFFFSFLIHCSQLIFLIFRLFVYLAKVKLFLTHEHTWNRLASSQLFGILFANLTPDELFNNKESYFNFKLSSASASASNRRSNEKAKFLRIRDLIDDFCTQLKAPVIDESLGEQIIKNLAFMAKLLKKYKYEPIKNASSSSLSNGNEHVLSKETNNENNNEDQDDDVDDEVNHDINLEWLIKKITKEAKYELVNKPKEFTKRTLIFKLLAAIAIDLDKQELKLYLNLIIPNLQREISIEQSDQSLKCLAQEVLDLIKQIVGVEEFTYIYSTASMRRQENKEVRKRKMAQEAVLDPQTAAMKKIRKMQRKKEAKKRKMEKNKFPESKEKQRIKKMKLISNDD